MTRGAAAAKTNKTRSTKSRKRRPRELASYAMVAALAACWALSRPWPMWRPAMLVAELALWIGCFSLLVALAHAALKQWDRALLALGVAVVWCFSLVPFAQSERPTPPHGPTIDLRHYHLSGQLPMRSAFEATLLTQPVHVVSMTFDSEATLRKLPRPPEGFRRVSAHGAGPRALWVRQLEAGSGASTLRVGGCSVALEQVSLPSIFALGRSEERRALLASLPTRPSHQPTIWLGHMGSTPTAGDVTRVLEAQAMRDARVRHGLLGTFPALFGPLGLSLDSPLVHGWIAVRSLETLDASALGATHRGVHVVLELTEPRCAKVPRRSR